MDRLKRVRGNFKGFLFPALLSTSKGDSSLNKPASYNSILAKFKAIVKEAGVASNPSAFGLHSMRWELMIDFLVKISISSGGVV